MEENLQYRWVRPCTRVWLFLMALTALALGVGKLALSGGAIMALVLATTFWKGQLIADYFMGLRRARLLWRALVWGWLLLVGGGVMLAYSLAQASR